MTTFNTGNPIGSTDARDLSDNAENFDTALGTIAPTWVDRLGVTRDSFEGRLAKGSFYRVGDFATGCTLTNMRQTLEYSGHEYSWSGAFPKVVAAGATPETTGGIGAGAWVDRTSETLRGELESASGISLVATNHFAVYVHSAPGDGTTDSTSFFTSAAALAKLNGVPVIVKPPAVNYLLSTNPTIPDNVDIIADPSWFSGAGLLPIHSFMAESEGVDPRIYHAKDWHHSVAPINNGERYWTGQHTVDIKYDQLYSGPDSVKQDCVGHGTRAYVRGKNGRGWGGVDLVALFPSAIGAGATDTSAYGREINVNNNAADINNFEVLGGPRCKGLAIASGGAYRPEEAIYIISTASTNRFLAAVRWSATAVEFGIAPDEGFAGSVLELPLSSKGVVGSYNHAEKATMHLSSDMSGWDFTGNTGGVTLHTDEEKTVVAGSLLTRTTFMSATLSASKSNCLYVTASMSVNTISNGRGGQEITVLVAAGVILTLNTGGNILLANRSNIGLAGRAAIRFRYEAGAWWQISPAVGGLA